MMHFKLHTFITIVALVASPWGGGSSVEALPLPPTPQPILPIIKMLEPIEQVHTKPMHKLALAAFPTAPPGTYANSYAPANCTWYVASMKRIPSSWGDAANWAYAAQAVGYTVSSIPIVGAIAQHGGGLGHVAVVRAISGGSVLIDEMNYDYNGSVRQDWQPIGRYVYIYL